MQCGQPQSALDGICQLAWLLGTAAAASVSQAAMVVVSVRCSCDVRACTSADLLCCWPCVQEPGSPHCRGHHTAGGLHARAGCGRLLNAVGSQQQQQQERCCVGAGSGVQQHFCGSWACVQLIGMWPVDLCAGWGGGGARGPNRHDLSAGRHRAQVGALGGRSGLQSSLLCGCFAVRMLQQGAVVTGEVAGRAIPQPTAAWRRSCVAACCLPAAAGAGASLTSIFGITPSPQKNHYLAAPCFHCRCVLMHTPSEGLPALQVVGRVLAEQAALFYATDAQVGQGHA